MSAQELDLAQPQPIEQSSLEAWYVDDTDIDQREEHRQTPNVPCSLETLRKLGVVSWELDADQYKNDPKLQAIRKVRGYSYEDIIDVKPTTFPNYEDKLKSFFQEHMHADEEIRYVLDGSGYFDVRNVEDKWIRIKCTKGAMIVLPAGIYHRFTLDTNNYIKAMRLFVGSPVWTPLNRPHDHHPKRKDYVENVLGHHHHHHHHHHPVVAST